MAQSKYQALANALASVDTDHAIVNEMDDRQKRLKKAKKTGGMFDYIFGQRRGLEQALSRVEE